MPEDSELIDGLRGVKGRVRGKPGAAVGAWVTDAGSLCPPGSGIECQFL